MLGLGDAVINKRHSPCPQGTYISVEKKKKQGNKNEIVLHGVKYIKGIAGLIRCFLIRRSGIASLEKRMSRGE